MSEELRKKMETQLQLSLLLTKYEPLFLGEKLSLFPQKLSLRDALELVLLLHESILKEKGFFSEFGEGDILLHADRHYLERSLEQVIGWILRKTQERFVIRIKGQQCIIEHDASSLDVFQEKDLLACLNAKEVDVAELGFQLALRLTKELGIKAVFKKKQVVFRFPRKKKP